MTPLLSIFMTAQELNAFLVPCTLRCIPDVVYVCQSLMVCRRRSLELWVQPVCSDGSWVKVELCVLFFRAEQLQCSCCCQCSAVSTSSGAKSCYFPQLCPFQWNLLVQDILHCLCSWSYNDYQGQCKGNVNLCNFSLDMPCPSSSASGCSSMGHYPISSAHFLFNEKVQI